jgi:hypothetical protein
VNDRLRARFLAANHETRRAKRTQPGDRADHAIRRNRRRTQPYVARNRRKGSVQPRAKSRGSGSSRAEKISPSKRTTRLV